MDKRLADAFDFVKYQNSLRIQRDLLENWLAEKLQYAYNGGIFEINTNLIASVKLFLDLRPNSKIVLLDKNNTPIRIDNLSKFLEDIMEIYFEVTNEYYFEYQKLKERRATKAVTQCNAE